MADEHQRHRQDPPQSSTDGTKGPLTGFVETVGDLASTTVKTAVGIGDEMIHGAGQLSASVVDEVGNVITTAADRLRGAFGTLIRPGRSDPPPGDRP